MIFEYWQLPSNKRLSFIVDKPETWEEAWDLKIDLLEEAKSYFGNGAMFSGRFDDDDWYIKTFGDKPSHEIVDKRNMKREKKEEKKMPKFITEEDMKSITAFEKTMDRIEQFSDRLMDMYSGMEMPEEIDNALCDIAKQIDNIRGSLTYLVQNYRG